MERHPKFSRFHEASSQRTAEILEPVRESQPSPQWSQGVGGYGHGEYIKVPDRWVESGKHSKPFHHPEHRSNTPTAVKVNNDSFGRSDWILDGTQGIRKVSSLGYSRADQAISTRQLTTQQWDVSQAATDKPHTGHLINPAADVNYLNALRVKSQVSDWNVNTNMDSITPSTLNKKVNPSHTRSPYIPQKSLPSPLDYVGDNVAQIPTPAAPYFNSNEPYPGPARFDTKILNQPPLVARPASREDIPQSAVGTQGSFMYSGWSGQPHGPPDQHVRADQMNLADAVPAGKHTNSNLAPTLMKLYEKYGIAALRLIYLQRTKDVALQQRLWNNSPQTVGQSFLDPRAADSPTPVTTRSPIPPQHVQIQDGHIQQSSLGPISNIETDALSIQNSDFDTISQPSPDMKQLDFNQQTWSLTDNQNSHLSPMPSPMPPSVQQYQTNSPYQADMAQGNLYMQPQDAPRHASNSDFYAEEQYRKTPDMDTNPPTIHNHSEPYNGEANKVNAPDSEEVPILTSMPTTFGLSAMRSHPEYDSFLPPRKKSRFAFEAAERLLASFSNVVDSASKSVSADRSDTTGSGLHQQSQYHDKLKAFSIHNQSTSANDDISLGDHLTSNHPSTDQLSLGRVESNNAGDIVCFQKDESNYAENDPISMKELQSALLDFDANTQVGEDMFDFDKNEDLDHVDTVKLDNHGKKDYKHGGKGLGKHSKKISSKLQEKVEPKSGHTNQTPVSAPARGRKPASKYSMGGIVCPRKAITKAWVTRQAKKNLDIVPKRMLRSRVPKKPCVCSEIGPKLKGKSIKTLARIRRQRARRSKQNIKSSSRCRHLVHKSGSNISLELSVDKQQKRKITQLQHKIDRLIKPKPDEMSRVAKDLQMLDALNQQLALGDKYTALLALIGEKSLAELECKLRCRENLILVPKTIAGLREVICGKKNTVNRSSACFCQKPWRIAPVDRSGKKQSSILQCKCDAGHKFVVYEYNDCAATNEGKKARKGGTGVKGSMQCKVGPENSRSFMKTTAVTPPEASSSEVTQTEQLRMRDIPFYKSTLPKKRGKLWLATSLALSGATSGGTNSVNAPHQSTASDVQTCTTQDANLRQSNKRTCDRQISPPAKTNTCVSASTPGNKEAVVTASRAGEGGGEAVSTGTAPGMLALSIDALSVEPGAIGAYTEVSTSTKDDKDSKCNKVKQLKPNVATTGLTKRGSREERFNSKITDKTTTENQSVEKLVDDVEVKSNESNSTKPPLRTVSDGRTSLVKPKKAAQTSTGVARQTTPVEPPPGGKKKRWETAALKQCPQCSYTTRVKSHLNRHAKTHDAGARLQCPHCPRTYCERPRLEEHVQAAHTEAGLQFPCPTCGRVYKTREGVRVHVRRDHRGEHPYVCEACGAGFQQIHQYEGHVNKHAGERPFKCDRCARGFMYRNNRNAHQKDCPGDKQGK